MTELEELSLLGIITDIHLIKLIAIQSLFAKKILIIKPISSFYLLLM